MSKNVDYYLRDGDISSKSVDIRKCDRNLINKF